MAMMGVERDLSHDNDRLIVTVARDVALGLGRNQQIVISLEGLIRKYAETHVPFNLTDATLPERIDEYHIVFFALAWGNLSLADRAARAYIIGRWPAAAQRGRDYFDKRLKTKS